jgi:crotonobetainyl-CoA:carnitine CoA-transferase CaiB-like acyl-CoA transferase
MRELPLHGYRVLEIGDSVAVRFAGRLLADLGADVVAIDSDETDDESTTYRLINRGKRSLAASRLDDAAWAALSARTDVIIASCGVSLPVNEQQIICRLPVLPEHLSTAVTGAEPLCLDAYTGLLAAVVTPHGGPGILEQPEGVFSTGALAALGCVCALLVRERTGIGQQIAVSWLAGSLNIQMFNLIANANVGMTARWPGDVRGWHAAFRLFRAGDGKWIYVACPSAAFWSRFCMAIERMDLAIDPRFENTPWQIADEDEAALCDQLIAQFARRPAQEWIELLESFDCIVGPVLTREGWLQHPQVEANGLADRVADPVLGDVVTAGNCYHFLDTVRAATAAPRKGSLPAGQLIAEWPALPVPSATTEQTGPPLSGTRVIDLGNYAAGPLVSRILSDLGADVIKVEPFAGDPFRGLALAFAVVNRGKRSLGLDLRRHDEASRVIARLLARSDAVVTNWRPSTLADLRVDRGSAHAVNDRLVYASISGYGSLGPWSGKPCVDLAVQAVTGWSAAQGPTPDEPEAPGPWPFDNATPVLVAVGVVAGLVARERGERLIGLDTSMVACAMAMQVDKYACRPDRQPGQLLTRHIRCENIATKDGWLTVATHAPGCEQTLNDWLGENSLGQPLIERLTERLAKLTTPEAFAALSSAGVSCAIVQDRWTVMNMPGLQRAQLLTTIPHSKLGPLLQLGKVIELSASDYELKRNYADIETDGTSVLADLGLSQSEVDRLHGLNIVRMGN